MQVIVSDIRIVNVMRYIVPLREGGSLPAIAEADVAVQVVDSEEVYGYWSAEVDGAITGDTSGQEESSHVHCVNGDAVSFVERERLTSGRSGDRVNVGCEGDRTVSEAEGQGAAGGFPAGVRITRGIGRAAWQTLFPFPPGSSWPSSRAINTSYLLIFQALVDTFPAAPTS